MLLHVVGVTIQDGGLLNTITVFAKKRQKFGGNKIVDINDV